MKNILANSGDEEDMDVEVRSSRRFLEISMTPDDSSDEEQCRLDDNDLRKLNSKLCTYEDNDSSAGEEINEETEEDNMKSIDACINKQTFEIEENNSSSEDEFEKEMEGELNKKVDSLEKAMGAAVTEEDFYDPKEDQRDQEWENETRRKYLYNPIIKEKTLPIGKTINKQVKNTKKVSFKDTKNDSKNRKSSKESKLPNSDAVLNCPCCMQLLCLDCQRHDIYLNQYRAMFVMNCKVINEEIINIPIKSRKRKWNQKKNSKENEENMEVVEEPTRNTSGVMGKDDFKGVDCEGCGTRVAVFDTDEVYHFFNVLSSH